MTQYFLTVPHDAADEPMMGPMQAFDAAGLEAMMAAAERITTPTSTKQASS